MRENRKYGSVREINLLTIFLLGENYMTTRQKSNLFQDLKKGLEEAIAWEQGKIDLRTSTLSLPDKPPKMSKKQIKDLRENILNVSQPVFALILGVSPAAVKAWEQGLKQPSGTARRLMQLFKKDPAAFQRLAS